MILTPQQVISKRDALKNARINWLNHWEEIAQYMIPRKDIINTKRTPGDKRNLHLFDNTGMKSLELLAGALHGLLTNPNGFFFELTTGNLELDDNDQVRKWLQESSRKMHNVLNNSNFQTEVHELYLDLCGFGTGAMSIESDNDKVVRFKTHIIDSIFVAENNLGVIDQVYREFSWDASQIIAEFGEKNVGEKVLKQLKDPSQSKKWKIIQAVYPKEIEPSKQVGLRFVSQYILEEEKHQLRASGFRELPYVVPRWSKTSGEIYGRSPAMVALPEVKTLNKMTETTLRGAQKVVDPALQIPDDGFIMPVRTRPGSLNYYRAGTPDRIESFGNDARIDFGYEAMNQSRERVRESFFVDQLNLKQGPQMTATEVLQRTEESMRLLGPVLGRQQSEFLKPMIDRVFEIMIARGMFSEHPDVLDGVKLDVQYSSLIAKTQRISEAQNILRTFEAATPFMQVDPSVADNFDGDAAVRFLSKLYSSPQEILRDKDKVEEMRKAKQEAQEEQQKALEEQQKAENASKLAPVAAIGQGQ